MGQYFNDLVNEVKDFFAGIDYIELTFKILGFFVVILLIYLTTRLIYLLLNHLFNITSKSQEEKQRRKTINKMLSSLLHYAFYLTAFLYLLFQFNVSASTLITGVGALGIIFSFAFQDLLKDIVAGFFVIIENSYDVGDEVSFGTGANIISGQVDNITLRSTVLIGTKGEKHSIRNAMLTNVANFSKTNRLKKIIIQIKKENDNLALIALLKEKVSLFAVPNVSLSVAGIISFDNDSVSVALEAKSNKEINLSLINEFLLKIDSKEITIIKIS